MTCKHRWIIPASLKPFVLATCKLCGVTREKPFRNNWRGKDANKRLVNPGSRRWNDDQEVRA